ncbi:hypothetical protein ACNKHR_03355 [Shigella flexneri]
MLDIQLLIGLNRIEEHFRSGTGINTPINPWQGLTDNLVLNQIIDQ